MSKQLVWLITGASTGLGLALTERLLARGDRVVATARKSSLSRFEPLLSRPETDRTRIVILELDITSPLVVLQDVVKQAVDHWGRIDVLVNNAGIGGGVGPSEELRLRVHTSLRVDLMLRVMTTNYAGTISITNAVLPHMRSRRAGTVLLVGSRTGYRNEFLGPSAYAASKAAVHSYGETLSAELAPFNIRVCVVVPGAFDTGLTLPVVGTPIPDYDEAREELRKRVEGRKRLPNQGDPVKGMNVLIDVVRGEGKAEGKGGLPLWLFLGSDCLADVKARADKLKRVAEEWADVGSGLGKDDTAQLGA
ncbi:NAD-P-binding protein [Trametes cingulata]|nr:NAD-P-binding protein [Trametes cingulata]